MTTGKGIAIGGGLVALSLLFSGGDSNEVSDTSAIIPPTEAVKELENETPPPPMVEADIDSEAERLKSLTNEEFFNEIEIEIEKEAEVPVPAPVFKPIPIVKPVSSGYVCNCSKTCPQMNSCTEAYYQLNKCGCSRRDGDSDGIPCESICR